MNTIYQIADFISTAVDFHSCEVSGSRVATISSVAAIIIFAIAL